MWKLIGALAAAALVVLSGTAASAAPTRYEAESSPASCDGAIDANWSGYSGSGFCNFLRPSNGADVGARF